MNFYFINCLILLKDNRRKRFFLKKFLFKNNTRQKVEPDFHPGVNLLHQYICCLSQNSLTLTNPSFFAHLMNFLEPRVNRTLSMPLKLIKFNVCSFSRSIHLHHTSFYYVPFPIIVFFFYCTPFFFILFLTKELFVFDFFSSSLAFVFLFWVIETCRFFSFFFNEISFRILKL